MNHPDLNILEALKECNICLVMLTQNFVKDESVWNQPIEANKMNMPLVAFIQNNTKMPERLKKLNWWKIYHFKDHDFEIIAKQLVQDLKEKIKE